MFCKERNSIGLGWRYEELAKLLAQSQNLVGFARTVTEVEENSQDFFLLFFDGFAEIFSRLRHR
jgi:hypothetical protein